MHSQHSQKYLPPRSLTDSQVLAVVYAKLMEMDERLLDPETGEVPTIKQEVRALQDWRTKIAGACRVVGLTAAGVGTAAAAIQVCKFLGSIGILQPVRF